MGTVVEDSKEANNELKRLLWSVLSKVTMTGQNREKAVEGIATLLRQPGTMKIQAEHLTAYMNVYSSLHGEHWATIPGVKGFPSIVIQPASPDESE